MTSQTVIKQWAFLLDILEIHNHIFQALKRMKTTARGAEYRIVKNGKANESMEYSAEYSGR